MGSFLSKFKTSKSASSSAAGTSKTAASTASASAPTTKPTGAVGPQKEGAASVIKKPSAHPPSALRQSYEKHKVIWITCIIVICAVLGYLFYRYIWPMIDNLFQKSGGGGGNVPPPTDNPNQLPVPDPGENAEDSDDDDDKGSGGGVALQCSGYICCTAANNVNPVMTLLTKENTLPVNASALTLRSDGILLLMEPGGVWYVLAWKINTGPLWISIDSNNSSDVVVTAEGNIYVADNTHFALVLFRSATVGSGTTMGHLTCTFAPANTPQMVKLALTNATAALTLTDMSDSAKYGTLSGATNEETFQLLPMPPWNAALWSLDFQPAYPVPSPPTSQTSYLSSLLQGQYLRVDDILYGMGSGTIDKNMFLKIHNNGMEFNNSSASLGSVCVPAAVHLVVLLYGCLMVFHATGALLWHSGSWQNSQFTFSVEDLNKHFFYISLPGTATPAQIIWSGFQNSAIPNTNVPTWSATYTCTPP